MGSRGKIARSVPGNKSRSLRSSKTNLTATKKSLKNRAARLAKVKTPPLGTTVTKISSKMVKMKVDASRVARPALLGLCRAPLPVRARAAPGPSSPRRRRSGKKMR